MALTDETPSLPRLNTTVRGLRRFPDWIDQYLATVSPRSESPEKFHFWCAVSTVAGALRRRVYLDMGHFSWFPNFYIVLVGEPAIVKKSSTINIGARLLREVPGVNFGSDIQTWQGFMEELEKAVDAYAVGDKRDIMQQMHVSTCALTLTIDEWGTFIDPEDHSMINVLTQMWDSKSDVPFKKSTKTQGENVIINPFVNMIAGTTPKWMADNFRNQFGGWGFSSRVIFVHAKRSAQDVPYPDEVWGGGYEREMKPLVDDLKQIARLQGPMHLTPAARDIGREWYKAHKDRMNNLASQENADPWLGYFLARKWDYAHKLAIILAASRRIQLEINDRDLRQALARMDEVEEELHGLFGTRIAPTKTAELNNAAWQTLKLGLEAQPDKAIRLTHAHEFLSRYMAHGPAREFLDQLRASGLIQLMQQGRTEWICLPHPEE